MPVRATVDLILSKALAGPGVEPETGGRSNLERGLPDVIGAAKRWSARGANYHTSCREHRFSRLLRKPFYIEALLEPVDGAERSASARRNEPPWRRTVTPSAASSAARLTRCSARG